MNDMKITDLPGVGPGTAEKLESAGLSTVLSIAVAHPSTLVDIAGMSEVVARKVIKAARDGMGLSFVNGDDAEAAKKTNLISTGSKAFDTILNGGVKSGGITEVFGQWGSGKTQVAMQLTVNALKASKDGVVVYIDTEGTFSFKRFREMAAGQNIDPDKELKRVRIAKAYNSDHQMFLAEQVEGLLKKKEKVLLIVVDSLTAHFRAEYVGRGTLADRQQKINKHMKTLSKMADLYEVVVFVTNQISSSPAVAYGDPNQAIGGNIVGHNSRERIKLRMGAKGTRVAKLIDSPDLPDAEATYIVTGNGLEDVE